MIATTSSQAQKLLITRFPLESAWGGEEEIHLIMAHIFRSQGKDVELLSSCAPLSQRFRAEGFPVHNEIQKDLTSKSQLLWAIITLPLFFLRGIFWIPYMRYVRGIRTVLFLTFVEKIAWTPLAKLCGMKIFWGHHAPLGTWFSSNPLIFLWKIWSRYARTIVASQYMQQQLTHYAPKPQTIHVIPNTLAPEKDISHAPTISRTRFRQFLNEKTKQNLESKETFFVGSANRLSREKGMFDLLQAAEKLKHLNITFLIAGTGAEQGRLMRQAREQKLHHVFFLGFLEPHEINIFLQGIDLFVLPSHQEPFGISLLEAMSAHKPIVASRVGGIPEVLGTQNAGLTQSHNPSELAKQIEVFATTPAICEKWKTENFSRFQQYFSHSAFLQKSSEIFFET